MNLSDRLFHARLARKEAEYSINHAKVFRWKLDSLRRVAVLGIQMPKMFAKLLHGRIYLHLSQKKALSRDEAWEYLRLVYPGPNRWKKKHCPGWWVWHRPV